MNNGLFSNLTRLSPRSQFLFNRFQRFFLISWLIFIIETVGIVATVLTTHPRPASPFFYVPMGILATTLVAFVILSMAFSFPVFRSIAADVRHRRNEARREEQG